MTYFIKELSIRLWPPRTCHLGTVSRELVYSEALVHLATLIAMKNNYASSFIMHLIFCTEFRNAAWWDLDSLDIHFSVRQSASLVLMNGFYVLRSYCVHSQHPVPSPARPLTPWSKKSWKLIWWRKKLRVPRVWLWRLEMKARSGEFNRYIILVYCKLVRSQPKYYLPYISKELN